MTEIVPPQAWRVIGDLPGDDVFIPFGPAARVDQLCQHRARHEALLKAHGSDAMLAALLEAHGPHEAPDASGALWLECEGCPTGYDAEWGEEFNQSWPCPTWTLISERTAD